MPGSRSTQHRPQRAGVYLHPYGASSEYAGSGRVSRLTMRMNTPVRSRLSARLSMATVTMGPPVIPDGRLRAARRAVLHDVRARRTLRQRHDRREPLHQRPACRSCDHVRPVGRHHPGRREHTRRARARHRARRRVQQRDHTRQCAVAAPASSGTAPTSAPSRLTRIVHGLPVLTPCSSTAARGL